jgi:hypothetical protein
VISPPAVPALDSEELRQGPGLCSPGLNLPTFRPNTDRMAKKPEAPKPTSWNVYKIVKRGVWLGTVEAPDKQSAIEKAAAEFKVDAWRLYAMERR